MKRVDVSAHPSKTAIICASIASTPPLCLLLVLVVHEPAGEAKTETDCHCCNTSYDESPVVVRIRTEGSRDDCAKPQTDSQNTDAREHTAQDPANDYQPLLLVVQRSVFHASHRAVLRPWSLFLREGVECPSGRGLWNTALSRMSP